MQGGVQVISKEVMKPTPQYPFKNLRLSYIDRSLPSMYIPLIFFYNADESTGLNTSNHIQISQILKNSLLATLPSFYPLAGKLKHNTSVDCNNASAGSEFVQAKVHAQLKTALQGSTVKDMKLLLPSECWAFDNARRPLLVVQVTYFDCGGIAVAICVSHKIADFASAMSFVAAWAAKCRGEKTELPPPIMGSYPYFGPMRYIPFSVFTNYFKVTDDFVTDRFVFDKEKIEILRRAATAWPECATKDPTRVELVSAFIWKHFMAAKSKNKLFAAIMAVSLRQRTNPPGILENVFGNCFMSPLAFADPSREFHELVSRLRRAIKRVRDGYITNVMSTDCYMRELVMLAVLMVTGKMEWCYFTSWRGFSAYKVDYGWGQACRFATPSMPVKNMVILVNSGDDIEVVVTMQPEVVQEVGAQLKLISIPK
ncbi:stemmadenine O-acetyltransferase-like [Salvia hispanica]|uniref:stemmadenine O-acetyltransferase-like n=1 Tax=Salvia hispanica TaxID=49212 RepID=UPI002009DA36|nr:stemmadenine O-acetyltransferase-like [Salvia hispanica]XP_047951879.1 stemmadenine O-acetyltransferase-like [Salvia hispanica]